MGVGVQGGYSPLPGHRVGVASRGGRNPLCLGVRSLLVEGAGVLGQPPGVGQQGEQHAGCAVRLVGCGLAEHRGEGVGVAAGPGGEGLHGALSVDGSQVGVEHAGSSSGSSWPQVVQHRRR